LSAGNKLSAERFEQDVLRHGAFEPNRETKGPE
jgi:hypothetical protein